MNQDQPVNLTRDVEAVTQSTGEKVILKKGQQVQITKSGPQAYTVLAEGRTFEINPRNADALGVEVKPAGAAPEEITPEQVEKQVWEALKNCYDPEIPLNIVELGLVYDCQVNPVPEKKAYRVDVKMTLTAPGCPLAGVITETVRHRLLSIPKTIEANVELVWDPPWNQNMLSDAAKLKLGLL